MSEKTTKADLDLRAPGAYEFFAKGDSVFWRFHMPKTQIHRQAVQVRYDGKTDQYLLSIQPVPRGTEC